MSVIFELPRELNIYSALETRDALLAWVSAQTAESSGSLEISAGKVSEIDGAGVQLLAALFNLDQPWHIVESSASFAEACKTMGFASWIGPRNVSNKPQAAT